MIRKVIIPEKNILSFPIPDKYIGKKMEVIAFTVDEQLEEILYSSKTNKNFLSANLSTKNFKFNRKEANER